MEKHLRLLVELVPDWLALHPIRKDFYLKLNKNTNMNLVLEKLNQKIKEEERLWGGGRGVDWLEWCAIVSGSYSMFLFFELDTVGVVPSSSLWENTEDCVFFFPSLKWSILLIRWLCYRFECLYYGETHTELWLYQQVMWWVFELFNSPINKLLWIQSF